MTTYDFILAKWPARAQRIIAAMYEEDKRGAEACLTEDVRHNIGWPDAILAGLFVWDLTPEGHEYWKQVAQEGGEK